jgi:glycosyltransferase involved in cell wall biosynthesis
MVQPVTVSIVVVAHDEERHIRRCLRSLEAQTLIPSDCEIVLVTHDCSDRTEAIAAEFPSVRVVPFRGPAGPVFARMEGFAQAGGEIVACIDGDCVAEPFWLAELTRPLQNPAISAVGGITIFHGNWFVWLGSYVIFYLANGRARSLLSIFIPKLHYPVFWGTSFACRRLDYHRIGGFAPLLDLRARLALPEWAEGFYLSLKLWQIGAIVFTRHPARTQPRSKTANAKASFASGDSNAASDFY